MNRAKTILLCTRLGFATLSGRQVFASPADLAEDLAALVAEGRGVLMPNLDEAHVEYRGVLTLSGDFPADFQLGLIPVMDHGVTVYPIAIRIDETTGDAVFYNAAETPFYTVPRVAPANWMALLSPFLANNPWFAESRVVAQWTLVPPESLDDYLAAANAPPPPLRSAPAPSQLEITNLMFTAISVSESNVVLDVAWPANGIPDGEPLDLYFSPELATNVWTLLDSATPTDPTTATFTVDGVDLPGFIDDVPPHIHDASCLPITNIMQSVFLLGEVETNIVYSCQTNPPTPPVSGFFRVGTRHDTDGDGLPDAYEMLVAGTDPLWGDTDGDGLFDDGETDAGTNPLVADTDGDGIPDGDELGSAHRLPVFVWRDVSGGTNLLDSSTPLFDARSWTLPLANPVSLDSNVFDRVQVGVDGYLHLLSPDSIPFYEGLSNGWSFRWWKPADYATNEMLLAACFLDWKARPVLDDAQILVAEDPASESLVVEWRNVCRYPGAPTATFQASIHPDHPGAVLFSYQTVSNAIASEVVAVGLQNRLRHDYAHPSHFQTSLLDYPSLRTVSDGLSVLVRPGTGTDPLSADTDADGLSDPAELHVHRTDPFSSDTDGDGLPDGAEIALGLDPCSPDTDGDGMPDGWEVANGLAPADPSDALLDGDSDGIPNAEEFGFGSDPALSDTDGDGLSDYAETPHLRVVPAESVPWFDLAESTRLTPTNAPSFGVFSFPLPSPASFCGIVCTNILADVSGLVTLPDARRDAIRGSRSVNQDLSAATIWANDCAIAAYWDFLQLRPALGSAIYAANVATNGETYCVVEYRNVGFASNATNSVTFQLSFAHGSPTNAVRVRYGEIRDTLHGASATFGMQGPSRCVSALLSHDAEFDVSGLAAVYEFGTGTKPWLADTDSDGASDAEEIAAGTNPRSSDTDGDAMPDVWEAASGLDPFSSLGNDGWTGDPDGDGVPNGEERYDGTSPLLCDTNGDGIPDGAIPAEWAAHPFLAANAGFTNLVLTVTQGMSPPLRTGNPPASSALLDVGGLKIPLYTGADIPLGLPGGVEIPAVLRVYGGLPVRLQLSSGPGMAPFRLGDSSGVFSNILSANAAAQLSFPQLSLIPLTDSGTTCLHDGDQGAAFRVELLPSGWNAAIEDAEIDGFELQADGTLWLDRPASPYATNSGTVTLRTPWLRWGTLSEMATVHWCASSGAFCHACGTVHTATDSCSHGADCAAKASFEAECDCSPIFLRVNFDDDGLNDVEDGNETPDVAWDEDLEEFRFVGIDGCCCGYWQAGDARARTSSLSTGLRLWSADGTCLLSGDEVAESAWIEATAHSPTNGAFSLSYDILDPTGGVARAMSRRFTAANVEILPDMDGNDLFDADDRFLRETLGPGGTWKVVRQAEPYRVRLRNACPSDATLRVLWSTEGTNGPAFSTDSNLTTQYLAPNAATTNAPFALPNLVDEFLIDASRTSAVATLTYSLDVGGMSPAVADSLSVRIVDIDLPDRAVRPSELASVEYDLSAASTDVSWILRDAATATEIDWWYGTVYQPPTNLSCGDYEVSAYVWDVWEDDAEGTYRTVTLRVADIAMEREAYATIADSAHRAMVSAAVSNVTGAISWTIEPALENGARLLSSPSSASGAVSLNGGTNVWISPGSAVRDYLVTATCSTETNLSASATVYVGCVNIDGDFFRNGGFADHPAEASPVDFLSSTGMVIIANNDDDNGDGEPDYNAEPSDSLHPGEFRINGADDLSEMPRLRISPLSVPSSCIPSNWTVRVISRSMNNLLYNKELHFFWDLSSGASGYFSFELSNQTLKNMLGGFGSPYEIGVEGFKYGSEYTVTLDLREGETSIASDSVRVLVAPFVALPQTAVTKFVYTGIDELWTNLNSTVHPALTGLVPWRSIGSMNFVQDFAELGVTGISTNHWNTGQNVILHLKQGHFNSEINATNAFYSIGGGDGGNVETLPPTPGHPLGQIVIGNNIDDSLRQFLQRQKVQTRSDGTLVELDTSWLYVKHVDELFSIVPTANGYRLLVADLQLAIDSLLANPTAQIERFQERSGDPRTTDEVYWKYMHEDYEYAVQNINSTLVQIRQTLSAALEISESDIIKIPVFFSVDGSSYPYTPNSINLLSVLTDSGARKLLIPDPFFAPMRTMIETRLAQAGYSSSQIVWIDSYNSDTYWGNVHCITNSRRKP